MLISFLTLILSFCIGILSGLFFRKRVPNFLGVVLACVIGAFIGILGARLGFPILDPIASVAICVLIVKASVDIFRDAIDKMVDHSCDEATEESMREVIMGVKGVKGIDLLQTRLFGSKMYVDIEISADGEIPLNEAHDIAENVHHSIEKNFKNVKHCMVHVNPVNE